MKKIWLFCGVVLLLICLILTGCINKKSNLIPNENKIVINSSHTADLDQELLEEKYAHAYRISGRELPTLTVPNSSQKLLTYDQGIEVEQEPDGIRLTNTTTTGNLFFKIGAFQKAGCFNFRAMGESCTIHIDLHVDVNGNDGGGTYIRAYNSIYNSSDDKYEKTARVIPECVIKKSVVLTNEILNTYTNHPLDNVYFQITLPKGGFMKIYDIYLYMETKVTGFDGMADKITGGGDSPELTFAVENADDFYVALNQVKEAGGAPAVIMVEGKITADDWKSQPNINPQHTYIDLGENTENLSIIGVGTEGIFDEIGLKIGGKNTIIENLTIRKVLDGDGILINGAKYTKVDHCTLYNEPLVNTNKDKYDELISLKNDAQYVILSWNELYNSHKTILVGSNDQEDALPDRKLIMHHNYIHDCDTRLPLYRGGYAHIYNNYYEDNTTGTGINCRTGSRILIENNYFKNCKDPIGFWYDDDNVSGKYQVRGNKFDKCSGSQPTSSTCNITFEPYFYVPDSILDVPNIVKAGAGVGILDP